MVEKKVEAILSGSLNRDYLCRVEKKILLRSLEIPAGCLQDKEAKQAINAWLLNVTEQSVTYDMININGDSLIKNYLVICRQTASGLILTVYDYTVDYIIQSL